MFYTDFDQEYDETDRKPWHQKYPLDPKFPFELITDSFKSYPYHWHKYMETIYIIKGNLGVSIGSRKYVAKEGDIFIINPDIIHAYYGGSEDVNFFVYLFSLELFDQSLVDLYDRLTQKTVFNKKTLFTKRDDTKLHFEVASLFQLIGDEFLIKRDGYRIAIKKHFYELALILLRSIPEDKGLEEMKKKVYPNFLILERIFPYIYDNYNNPEITLDSIAQIACLSKFYFSRFFREKTGLTFHTYLSRYRINRAQILLSQTDKTVTDIAFNCGFTSLKTFNRLFKNFTGVSPSTFKISSNIDKF